MALEHSPAIRWWWWWWYVIAVPRLRPRYYYHCCPCPVPVPHHPAILRLILRLQLHAPPPVRIPCLTPQSSFPVCWPCPKLLQFQFLPSQCPANTSMSGPLTRARPPPGSSSSTSKANPLPFTKKYVRLPETPNRYEIPLTPLQEFSQIYPRSGYVSFRMLPPPTIPF